MKPHDAAKHKLMMDVLLFRLAIVAWLVCAIAPIDGTWFAGAGVFVVSMMGSVVMLATLTPDYVDSLGDTLGLLALFMPGYNLFFYGGYGASLRLGRTPGQDGTCCPTPAPCMPAFMRSRFLLPHQRYR